MNYPESGKPYPSLSLIPRPTVTSPPKTTLRSCSSSSSLSLVAVDLAIGIHFSHGSYEYHQETLDNLQTAMDNTGILCAVMLDTKAVDCSPVSSVVANKASFVNASTSGSQKIPVNKMVRTDSQDPSGRMHAYFQAKPSRHYESNSGLNSLRCLQCMSSIRQRRNPKETTDLTSVQELIDEFERGCHSGLLETVRNCKYVGMVDDDFALLQHNTHLYLANVVNLSKELMYQLVLQGFGYFNAIQLSEPAPLQELIMMALTEEDPDSQGVENDDLKGKIAQMNAKLLSKKYELLDEYFGIHVDPQANLSRLPVILDQYTPDMDRAPKFLLCLGNDVTWNDEVCFQTIVAALGNFYAMHPPLLPNPSGEGVSDFYKRQGKGNVSGGTFFFAL
ncbi:unnamed protein product [Lactuca virosa]|uniref:DNA mismatch repair protein Mlh1 C-terminal domain-containing protein n=1 Tax=Lactuca virosa TaxID=75947 RepID=A0AAU9MF45_9ASTR|nr:unnamed protein product [Lactuca virosa]